MTLCVCTCKVVHLVASSLVPHKIGFTLYLCNASCTPAACRGRVCLSPGLVCFMKMLDTSKASAVSQHDAQVAVAQTLRTIHGSAHSISTLFPVGLGRSAEDQPSGIFHSSTTGQEPGGGPPSQRGVCGAAQSCPGEIRLAAGRTPSHCPE